MKLGDIHQDENTKDALLNIIDDKITDDMKEILQKMDTSNKILGEKISSVEKSFSSVEKKFARQNQMILWVIGIAMAIMLAIIALK